VDLGEVHGDSPRSRGRAAAVREAIAAELTS
jgi:hypothetical protein